jgi:hypothetical protein
VTCIQGQQRKHLHPQITSCERYPAVHAPQVFSVHTRAPPALYGKMLLLAQRPWSTLIVCCVCHYITDTYNGTVALSYSHKPHCSLQNSMSSS